MATYYTNWSFTNSSSPNSATYEIDGKKVTYYNDVRYRFDVYESVNKSANKSTITIKKYAVYYWTWPESGGSIKITMKSKAGSYSYYSESKSISASKSSSSYTLVGTDSFSISHNKDGSGSTTIAAYGTYTGGSGTTYTRSISKSWTFTKIDRHSTVDNKSASKPNFGDTLTFKISRQDSDFRHTLTYSMNGCTGTIVTKTADTTVPWNTSSLKTKFINATPNSESGKFTITCTTYYKDSKLGTDTCTCTCYVPASYVPTCTLRPTIFYEWSGTEYVPSDDIFFKADKDYYILDDEEYSPYTDYEVNDPMTTLKSTNESPSFFMQNYDQLSGEVIASGVEGSTIKSYAIEVNGGTFNTKNFLTGTLTNSGENTIKVKVTDSRGRFFSIEPIKFYVTPYFYPTISNCEVKRCNEDGTLSEDGVYGKAILKYKVSTIKNNQDENLNYFSFKIYRKDNDGYPLTIDTNYLANKEYYKRNDDQYILLTAVKPNVPASLDNNTYHVNDVIPANTIFIRQIKTADSEEDNLPFEGEYTFEAPYLMELKTEKSYAFIFRIDDKFNAIQQEKTVSPIFVTMSLKAGGKGISFGQTSREENTLTNYMDTKLYGTTWTNDLSINKFKTVKISEGSWLSYEEN